MSLIYSVGLNGESLFDTLVALQRYHEAAAAAPADWIVWSYWEAAACLGKRGYTTCYAAVPACPRTARSSSTLAGSTRLFVLLCKRRGLPLPRAVLRRVFHT